MLHPPPQEKKKSCFNRRRFCRRRPQFGFCGVVYDRQPVMGTRVAASALSPLPSPAFQLGYCLSAKIGLFCRLDVLEFFRVWTVPACSDLRWEITHRWIRVRISWPDPTHILNDPTRFDPQTKPHYSAAVSLREEMRGEVFRCSEMFTNFAKIPKCFESPF